MQTQFVASFSFVEDGITFGVPLVLTALGVEDSVDHFTTQGIFETFELCELEVAEDVL